MSILRYREWDHRIIAHFGKFSEKNVQCTMCNDIAANLTKEECQMNVMWPRSFPSFYLIQGCKARKVISEVYTASVYFSVLSLGARRMLKPDMGSIFHIKNEWNILVIGNYYVNYQNYQNAFNPPGILNEHWCIQIDYQV